MKIFISGWAGFREALEDVPKDWHFILPFIDLKPEKIREYFKNKSGQTLVAWSTGGHIVLKELNFFAERFKEIIIVSGFRKFTEYVNPRIVKRMIHKMETHPRNVIEEFLINAGVKPVIPTNLSYSDLIEGLVFLINSSTSEIKLENPGNVLLIHGSDDRIVPTNALKDLGEIINGAKSFIVEGPHWVGFRKILEVRASALS